MTQPLRIAMLAHSTNPRGGVVHALQLSEALTDLGHEVVLHAPDVSGNGFFRTARCQTRPFPVAPAPKDMSAMVEQRIADYVCHFERAGTAEFDLFHVHDGISGNALATLKEKGLIREFVRTVHHVDQFSDPHLNTLQSRSIDMADSLFTVSDHWRDWFRAQGRDAVTVGNGVDTTRFRPQKDESDVRLTERLPPATGPVFLAIGGIESRKNTLGILKAFTQVLAVQPHARLLIAGGVSLLDHSSYQAAFSAELAARPALAAAVTILGGVADAEMPALFRSADTLVFPSLVEGFGLVVLEAMATGIPVVLSSIQPFTGYVPPAAAVWCDPLNPTSIANAMLAAVSDPVRVQCVAAGQKVARQHDWRSVVQFHLPVYRSFLTVEEMVHA